jgi:hypothetical protein
MRDEFADRTPEEVAAINEIDEQLALRHTDERMRVRLEQIKSGRVRPRSRWSAHLSAVRQRWADALIRLHSAAPTMVHQYVARRRSAAALTALPSPDRDASMEFLQADLRRLYRQRLENSTQSLVWHMAVMRAYDARLRVASNCLGIPEHLDALNGMDLEVERLRIESELERAGLVLKASPDTDRHPEP